MADYKKIANEARKEILTMVHKAQTSHIASNFSVIDIATVLYENLKPEDRVVWSKGWAAASIYYFNAKYGRGPQEALEQFPKEPYFGLAETTVEGVEVNGGSVGHGLSVAVGMALGKKRANESGTVYCIMSDGEWDEGSVWEASLFAGHHKLDNLVAVTDFNLWQAMGKKADVLDVEPATEKWEAFNWNSVRVDGHDHHALDAALFVQSKRPMMVVAETCKGKGVSFFENPPEHKTMGQTGHLYHYKNISDELFVEAMEELHA